MPLDATQARHVGEVEHGLRHFQAHLRVHCIDVQQVRLGADKTVERHHDGFANRVDGWVGDLRKELLEVVVERLVFVGQHRQWRVVAHRANALFTAGCHGRHEEFDVLLCVAKSLLSVQQSLGKSRCFGLGLNVVQSDAHVVDPLPIGLGKSKLVLQLFVVNDAALFQVDEEHAARLQTPLLDDAALGNGQHAGLGGHHHQVVVGHDVACRTQAIAVERGANLFAVRKDHGGRAVPGFQHGCVVFVERAAPLVHQFMLLPGFRDHHHRCVRQRVARHGHQLERVVECRGVALAFKTQGIEFLQVVAQHGRLHHAFTRAHPVEVALHGVDFAVVRHHPVGVGQRPFREGVGRKALVHQGQR